MHEDQAFISKLSFTSVTSKLYPVAILITTHLVIFAVRLGLVVNAGLATGDNWKEHVQSFGGSRLIHVTSIDFTLLSTFAPFWVYNDMSARRWTNKGFWLLPLSVVPFLGPALYVLLRPSLSTVVTSSLPALKEE